MSIIVFHCIQSSSDLLNAKIWPEGVYVKKFYFIQKAVHRQRSSKRPELYYLPECQVLEDQVEGSLLLIV